MRESVIGKLKMCVLLLTVVAVLPSIGVAKTKLTMVVQDTPPDPKVFESLAVMFAKQQPQVEITVVPVPFHQVSEKVMLQVAGGVGPDLVYHVPRGALGLYLQGVAVPLDRFLSLDPQLRRDIIPPALAQNSWRGSVFALPTDWGGHHLEYNMSMIAERGLRDPVALSRDGDWNRQTFENVLRKLTMDLNGDGQNDQFGVETLEEYSFPPLFGGEWFADESRRTTAIDSPATMEGWQWIYDMRHVQQVVGGSWQRGTAAFYNTNHSTLNTIKAWAREIGIEWNMVEMPVFVKPASALFTGTVYMVAQSPEKQAATWDFIRFLFTAPAMEERIRGVGRVPSRLSMQAGYIRSAQLPDNALNTHMTTIDRLVPFPTDPFYSRWWPIFSDHVLTRSIAQAKVPVQQAASEAARLINQALAEEWAKMDESLGGK